MAKFERAEPLLNPLSLFTSLIAPEIPGENLAGGEKTERYYRGETLPGPAPDSTGPSSPAPVATGPPAPVPTEVRTPAPPALSNYVDLKSGRAVLDGREIVIPPEALANLVTMVAMEVADDLAAQAQSVLSVHAPMHPELLPPLRRGGLPSVPSPSASPPRVVRKSARKNAKRNLPKMPTTP